METSGSQAAAAPTGEAKGKGEDEKFWEFDKTDSSDEQ